MQVMSDHASRPLVDIRHRASVSFPPPDPGAHGLRRTTPARGLIAVGPGRGLSAVAEGIVPEPRGAVSYPIQPGKIQAPGLRDETLARMRLLDWLDAKIHSRVVYVIADAGYGKTTLLADFSRRTRIRTIWYRLDEDDRDWVGFLSHLVAAGREHDPDFAPRTAAMLRALEPGGTTRDDAIEAFIAELPTIATDGAALIFDDFHLADEVTDVRLIAREIVARAPERLTVVFASRRAPAIPVARLRTVGELAELGLTDLRFSEAEMEQLFRETFNRPLEPDVLADLAERTEGWAASLTLVQAALRERGPAEVRAFVRGLSGARDELHDYLAEEVVGDLPVVQQQFLMRTSILQRVTPELAQVASGMTATEVQALVTEAERLGMLGRRASRRSTEQRYHPLVREFLEERLRREVGLEGIDELHLAVARWAETTDWQTAAHHYAAARRWDDLLRVLELHLETIVGLGAFAVAATFITSLPNVPDSAAVEVMYSRQASVEGDVPRVRAHALRARELDPQNEVVVGNLLSANMLAADTDAAIEVANELASIAKSPLMRMVAKATTLLLRSSVDFDLAATARTLEELAGASREAGLPHFEGVSWLNCSNVYRAQGRFPEALGAASRAIDSLSTSSSGNELAAAWVLKASIVAFMGRITDARQLLVEPGADLRHSARSEFLAESADIEALFGDVATARHLLREIDESMTRSSRETEELARIVLDLRDGLYEYAATAADALAIGRPSLNAGHGSRALATQAMAFVLAGRTDAEIAARRALKSAERQNARLWRELASLALASNEGNVSPAIIGIPESLRCVISLGAELIAPRLSSLSGDALGLVHAEVASRRSRWLPAIRGVAVDIHSPSQIAAARLLDEVGQLEDVALLRGLARRQRLSGNDRLLGRSLARRLAPRVFIEDLGRVVIKVGDAEVSSREVRRKVLAMLCFLLTRPRFAAAREEVMDAMWPDMDPAAAMNSLNQSVYFLRRVFEPDYSEETSPGYVHQDADVLWLDPELIDSRSRRCVELIAKYGDAPQADTAMALSRAYLSRFALDFTYDDWSADYREWLHVAYLHVIEAQVSHDINHGKVGDGVAIARRALEVDPRRDDLEVSLLRLLRNAGAHAAAAEQYGRYANHLRDDLGVEAPPLEAL